MKSEKCLDMSLAVILDGCSVTCTVNPAKCNEIFSNSQIIIEIKMLKKMAEEKKNEFKIAKSFSLAERMGKRMEE